MSSSWSLFELLLSNLRPVLEGKPANGPVLLEKFGANTECGTLLPRPICRNLLDDLEQSPNVSWRLKAFESL